MTSFDAQFLAELKAAISAEGHSDLSEAIDHLSVHEYVEGQCPTSQFIYTVPKSSLPNGRLSRLVVGGVPGLTCLLLEQGRIAAVETLGRDVLRGVAT